MATIEIIDCHKDYFNCETGVVIKSTVNKSCFAI